jgi:transcriptional antiterminator NusG
MAGMEQKCLQQCRKYVAERDYREMFIPQYTAQKHFRQEWHEVKMTLFPGYLFVDTETIEAVMTGLKKIRQYTKVLRDGETVSPITQEEQKFLADMMDEDYTVCYSEGFLIGDEVVVTKGPLKHMKGFIRTIDRHRRVAKMEVRMFGRSTPMEIGFGAVARVSGEEFQNIVEENIQKQKESGMEEGTVRIRSGVFAGMSGKLLASDEYKDEWSVEMNLFGNGTEVVFRRDEIELFP